MSKSIREQLRAATLGAKVNVKEKTVQWNGFDVVFRTPTLRVRQELLKRSKDENGDVDFVLFLVHSVQMCTFTSDGEQVFEPSDIDVLMEQYAGGFLDEFGAHVAELMNAGDKNPK